jgi:1,4-dihydroxy-2-naphthoate polyprenyltransferase
VPAVASSWWLAARPRTLPAAFAPVALGTALAWHAQHVQPIAAALCAAFALLAQVGANLANDYFDFKKGADAPGRLGPTRAVAAGLIAPAAMRRAMFGVLALAAAAGGGLIYFGGWWMVAVGAACLVAALAYTGGPYPLAYHGLGEACTLIFFGWVAVTGTYFVQAGWPLPVAVWIVATACGLLAANILLVNNIRDVAADARAGKRTLVVRFGRTTGQRLYVLGVAASAIAPAALLALGYGDTVLVAWLATPVGMALERRLAQLPEGDGPGFNRLLARTAQWLALWAALLSLGIVFA